MLRFEALALAISKINGGLDDPDSRAFKLCNPGLLKTYRPEKKADSEHYRIFSTAMGGFKALLADLQIKCSGENNRLTPQNTLRDLLAVLGFTDDRATRKILLFAQRALQNENLLMTTRLEWFQEPKEPKEIKAEE